jgi:hypothetical protein
MMELVVGAAGDSQREVSDDAINLQSICLIREPPVMPGGNEG